MKSVFKLNIDVSAIKGAIQSLTDLNSLSDTTKKSFGNIANDLVDKTPGAVTALTKIRTGVDKLKLSVNNVIDKFSSLGMVVRGLATNAFSKLTSVFKTGLMTVGSLIGGVTALFNMANGSNRTQTEASLAGLSWAEQKALDDANSEIGFNADFATNRAGFHQGADTMEAKALLNSGILTGDEFERLKNDSLSYYKLNDKLFAEYKRIRSSTPDESVADETFKTQYGNILSQFGYGDFASFKLANQNGVIDRHKQIFSDTHSAYSGVDSQALIKGERALNKFSETLKALALGVASKFLPGLTKGLQSLTKVFKKVSEAVGDSSLIKNIADLIGSTVELIVTAVEKLFGWVSKLMGQDIKNFTHESVIGAAEGIKGVTSFLKDDKEAASKHFGESGKNLKSAGSRLAVGASLMESKAFEATQDIDNTIQEFLDPVREVLGIEPKADKIRENHEKIEDVRRKHRNEMRENYLNGEKPTENLIHTSSTTVPVNIYNQNNKPEQYHLNISQSYDAQGRILQQKVGIV